MDLNSIAGLEYRATNKLQSVALFTDEQLKVLAEASPERQILNHLLGEMLVRTWLYLAEVPEIEATIGNIAARLTLTTLVKHFKKEVQPLRTRPWPVEEDSINKAFSVGTTLDANEEQFWEFVERRVRSLLSCDGVIPVVIANDAVAIPFHIRRHIKNGKILDSDRNSIEGWVSEADELWRTLGYRFDVRLGCGFGVYANLWNGKPLVSGGSFALPILFSATRSKNEDIQSLDVICTGCVLNEQIREVDRQGRERKQALAKRIGAFFVAPGVGEPWFLPPTLNIQEAIAAIWQKLGKDEQEIRTNIVNAFTQPEDGSFGRDMEELSKNFVGREEQIQAVTDWVRSTREQGGSACRLWIGGEAGCGKSAFMAALVRKYAGSETWFPIPYFFGKVDNPTQDDFFHSATMQLTATFELDLESVRNETPKEQFLFALDGIAPEKSSRVIFFIDGLNEAKGPLDKLAEVAGKTSQYGWVFSGQDTRETLIVSSEAKSFSDDGLGRLPNGVMRALIRANAPGISEELIKAITKKAEGLPLYSHLVLEEWRTSEAALDPTKLPDKVQDYYGEIIEGITTQRHRREAPWRNVLLDIFAVFATAHENTLTAATVTYMLSRARRCSQSDVAEALTACSAVLEEVQIRGYAETGPSRWRFRHDSFRQFLLRDESMMRALESTRIEWLNVCHAWNSENLEPGAREYALRFLVTELTQAGQQQAIIELAKNKRFLDAQSATLGPHFPLDTLACGLEIALREEKLADAAALTLARARRAEGAYAESPWVAMRARNNSRALELIERIENQNDRTLWHLALAAWHANGNRVNLAAKILDNEIPATALRDNLSGGASLCAAVLLSLLTDVWTRRFQWGWFLSRLDDESKQKIVPLLVNSQRLRLNATWQILGSIENPKLRDNARQDVVRELASFNPVLAERQLARFDSTLSRAWAAVEIVAAFVARRQWNEVDRVIDWFVPENSAQLAKALAHKSAGLKSAGLRDDARDACLACLGIIRKCFPDDPAQQAKSYAEFAKIEAEAGFVQHAAFGEALNIAKNLHDTRIGRAKCFTALVNSLAPAVRHGAQVSQLREALDHAQRELSLTPVDKADHARLRLMGALARSEHFEMAREILTSIKDETLASAGAGRFCAYLIRVDHSPPTDLYRQARGADDGMLFHGLIALVKANKNPSAAVAEICQSLAVTRARKSTQHWGNARILGEAGMVLSGNNNERAGEVFEAGRVCLDQISEKYRGRHLVNLAALRAESGNHVAARDLLAQARKCVPDSEEDNIALLAEIESAESRYKIANPAGLMDGVFQRVKGMANDNLVQKLGLYCQLVSPFAEANRHRELEDVCLFALGRLEDRRFLPSPQQRSALAGRFAGKLSKSALKLNGFSEWTGRFVDVCQQLKSEYDVPVPADALRAKTLMQVAEGEFNTAAAAALKIGSGDTRSTVFRDLAIRAVREGDCERALRLCTRITHERSQHLPNIGREIVERNTKTDSLYLNQLMVLCSEYSDAAYRIISSFVRFHKPSPEVLFALLQKCDVCKERQIFENQ